jgi:hypothetical protein
LENGKHDKDGISYTISITKQHECRKDYPKRYEYTRNNNLERGHHDIIISDIILCMDPNDILEGIPKCECVKEDAYEMIRNQGAVPDKELVKRWIKDGKSATLEQVLEWHRLKEQLLKGTTWETILRLEASWTNGKIELSDALKMLKYFKKRKGSE